MKTKITRKDLRASYGNIISIGYCDIQTLLRDTTPYYYLTRVEGWAADVYVVGRDAVIVTGYAPFGNIVPSYELQRKYEMAARRVIGDGLHINTVEKQSRLEELRDDFVNECLLQAVLTKKELEEVKNNLNSFIVNFGVPRIKRADYGRGLYVYMGESDSYIQYCHNISYFDGWLYGAVQAANRAEFKMRGGKNEKC